VIVWLLVFMAQICPLLSAHGFRTTDVLLRVPFPNTLIHIPFALTMVPLDLVVQTWALVPLHGYRSILLPFPVPECQLSRQLPAIRLVILPVPDVAGGLGLGVGKGVGVGVGTLTGVGAGV
jgi:hypothetical protein